MTWQEAMDRFGSDKPDLALRHGVVELDATCAEDTSSRCFQGALAARRLACAASTSRARAETLTRKEIDKLTEWIKAYGAKGLAWTRLADDGETSSL